MSGIEQRSSEKWGLGPHSRTLWLHGLPASEIRTRLQRRPAHLAQLRGRPARRAACTRGSHVVDRRERCSAMLPVNSMPEPERPESSRIRRLKRSEYERLAESGAFDDEKVELLDGIIFEMSPQGLEHSDLVALLNELVVKALPPTHQLRPQLPFALSDYSMPEPDLVVVPRRPFGAGHPTESVWMVEVSATSLSFDRDVKLTLYAAAGVPEYWIVNTVDMQIEVHRQPAGKRFHSVQTCDRFARVSPLVFPAISICLDDLIGASGT